MVVTNHPLASAAAAEMLLGGGNAVDAAVAALFALTVVEPMMVGILGGGVSHLRLPDGRHIVIDDLRRAPAAARADMYEPVSDGVASARDTRDRKNAVGAAAVAVPGALAGWCRCSQRYGTRPLHAGARARDPPRRATASSPRPISPNASAALAADLARDPGLAALFLPGGAAIAGRRARSFKRDYAATCAASRTTGRPRSMAARSATRRRSHRQRNGGTLIASTISRPTSRSSASRCAAAIAAAAIVGPPPPASGGVHIAQMLNILEGFDIGAMGFGSPDSIHLLAEALKIAFADRAVATADPAFVKVPVERLISKAYARRAPRARSTCSARRHLRRAGLGGVRICRHHACDRRRCRRQRRRRDADDQRPVRRLRADSRHRHDRQQLHVQLRSASGPRALDRAGQARLHLDGADDGAARTASVRLALGLPGGLRIFPSALQAIVNLIDHGMSVQEAVEAPRIWTEGGPLELEPAYSGRDRRRAASSAATRSCACSTSPAA